MAESVETIECNKCEEILPASPEYYHRDSTKASGWYPVCKVCRGNGGYGLHKPSFQKEIGDDEKYCKHCDRILPKDMDHFYRNRTMSDGFDYPCKECQGHSFGIKKLNDFVEDGYRFCWKCEDKKVLNSDNFYHSENCTGGFAFICIECAAERHKERKISSSELDLILDFFKSDSVFCVYCNQEADNIHYDHIIPLCRGGETRLGNMVPSCERCNLSKGTKNLEDWYPNQNFFDEDRLLRIQEYQDNWRD